MSEMEWHKGKAKKFERLDNESNLDYAKRYAASKSFNFCDEDDEDDLDEICYNNDLLGSWKNRTAIVAQNCIWDLIDHKESAQPPEVSNFNIQPDGTIDFEFYFYNGGECFSGMFENQLRKSHK